MQHFSLDNPLIQFILAAARQGNKSGGKIMDPAKMVKEMVDYYKSSFDNTYNTIVLMQDQMQKMYKMILDQSTGFPEEGKKAINEWTKAYKKGCEDFKSAIDDTFKRADSYFTSTLQTSKK